MRLTGVAGEVDTPPSYGGFPTGPMAVGERSEFVSPSADGRLGVRDVPGLVVGVAATPVFSLVDAVVTFFRGERVDSPIVAKRFDGTDTIRFCARCHPEIVVGYACEENDIHAYVKFLAPISCKFCTAHNNKHVSRQTVPCVLFVDRHQYQMFATYTGMSLPDRIMGKDKPIHGATIVQLDDRDNYNDVSAFLQQHIGTIAAMAHTFNVSPGGFGVLSRTLKVHHLTMSDMRAVFRGLPRYNEHVEGYTMATQWKLLDTEPYTPSDAVLSQQVTREVRLKHLGKVFHAFLMGTYKSRLERDKFIGPMPRVLPTPPPRRHMRNGTWNIEGCLPSFERFKANPKVHIMRCLGVAKQDCGVGKYTRSLFHRRTPLMTLEDFLGTKPATSVATSDTSGCVVAAAAPAAAAPVGTVVPSPVEVEVSETITKAAKLLQSLERHRATRMQIKQRVVMAEWPAPVDNAPASARVESPPTATVEVIPAATAEPTAPEEFEMSDDEGVPSLIPSPPSTRPASEAGDDDDWWWYDEDKPAPPEKVLTVGSPAILAQKVKSSWKTAETPAEEPERGHGILLGGFDFDAPEPPPQVEGPPQGGTDLLIGMVCGSLNRQLDRVAEDCKAQLADISGNCGCRNANNPYHVCVAACTCTCSPAPAPLAAVVAAATARAAVDTAPPSPPATQVDDSAVVKLTDAGKQIAAKTAQIHKGILAMRETDELIAKRHYYLNRMRMLWIFIEEHGTLPGSLLVHSDGALLDHILKGKSKARYEKLVKGLSDHIVIVNREVQTRDNDVTWMSNPPGQKMVVDRFKSAGCNGPISVAPTVHKTTDKRSVISAADVRMVSDQSQFYIEGVDGPVDPDELIKRCNLDGSNPGATEKPDKIKCRVEESPYGKFMGFCKKFGAEYMTNKRFNKIYNHLFGDKSVFDLDLGKFTPQDVAAACEDCLLYRSADDVPVRASDGKLESLFKNGKAGRLIQNCGIFRLLLTKCAGKSLSEFVFGKEFGLFYRQSIKERDRATLVQEFLEHLSNPWNEEGMENATPSELLAHVKYREEQNRRRKKQGKKNRRQGPKHPTCMVELDQTKMESHEDIDKNGQGLLSGIYMLLRKVAEMSARKLAGMFGWTLLDVLDGDEKDGLVLKFKIKTETGDTEQIFMKFDRLFLDSGWLLTSLTNFFNEFVGFYCSVTTNPNHLMAQDKDGEYRLRTGDFDWEFESIPLYRKRSDTTPTPGKVRIRVYTEGDDLAGAASGFLADPRNSGARGLIIRMQESLGYNGKLVVTINGRVEMVGTHFKAVDGRLSYTLPPCPDLKKAICKLGCRTSHNLDPAADVCQKLSMAMSLDGSVECLSDAYMKLSENLLRNGSLNKTKDVTFDGYCTTSRVFGLEPGAKMSLQEVLKRAYARDKKPLDNHVQAALMENSFSVPGAKPMKFRAADLSKLGLWAAKCAEPDYNQEAVFHQLPVCVRDFFSR